MNLTEDGWNSLCGIIKTGKNLSTWVIEQAELPFNVVNGLPEFENVAIGCNARPTIEDKILEKDYLAFLRQQVTVDARGPKWLELLNCRITALEPFVGKRLLTIRLHKKPKIATIRVEPETGQLVYFEELSWLEPPDQKRPAP